MLGMGQEVRSGLQDMALSLYLYRGKAAILAGPSHDSAAGGLPE